MDTDYQNSPAKVSSRELDRFENLAAQAEGVADTLERALDRFRGGGGRDQATLAPVASGHVGQIDRLATQLSRAESLSHLISEIM